MHKFLSDIWSDENGISSPEPAVLFEIVAAVEVTVVVEAVVDRGMGGSDGYRLMPGSAPA